ncbi:MAG: TdeIII family type II restriction endonuclease [Chloroflexi bacterium]|nr:TdeIII family type II restriction endonuclease [Chloroflexota bacterium]
MNRKTRKAVYSLLKDFVQKSLKSYDIEELKQAYPFHRLFFDEVGLVAFKQERSVVTRMGQQLYPDLAECIATEHYQNVTLEHEITGTLKKSTADTISRIVRELRSRQRQPNHAAEIAEIVSASRAAGKATVEVRVIADLYIGDFRTGPFFAEIKTPLPNLDICAETKHKILTFIALLHQHNPQGYLAFPYNPFITRADYKHSFTKQIMDLRDEVLMAGEFWDEIGGKGTFDQLLEIIERVGNDLREEKDNG